MKLRLVPRSLTLRVFALLLLGVLLAAALTFGFAQRDRREVIAHFHGREGVQRFSDMLRLLGNLPPAQRQAALAPFNPDEWRLAAAERCTGTAAELLLQGLRDKLGGTVAVSGAFRIDSTEEPPLPPTLAVQGSFPDGEPFCLMHRAQRRMPPQIEQWRFPVSLAAFVGLIALVSWFAVRLALRPLKRMAAAAEAFGRDIRHPPIGEDGPSEVRQAAQAFNAMQERVRGYMAERTQILAAVTHDLKTPLTRMRLRIEASNDEALREKLGNDLDAMQSLIEEGLELARSLEANETAVRVDLDALLSSLADDAADAGQPVSYSAPQEGGPILIDARQNGLRRAIDNLIDNALKYGQEAAIALTVEADTAIVRVLDRGPGIPEASLKDVMQPFVRLEGSRSRESGGTGLGLAIANNLLAAQGATLALRNRPEGGLEARIDIPLRRQ